MVSPLKGGQSPGPGLQAVHGRFIRVKHLATGRLPDALGPHGKLVRWYIAVFDNARLELPAIEITPPTAGYSPTAQSPEREAHIRPGSGAQHDIHYRQLFAPLFFPNVAKDAIKKGKLRCQ
jgi:hypothetical protein